MKKASIVSIGDEILIGQIVNTNAAWLGRQLNDVGFDIHSILTVADTEENIIQGLEQVLSSSDLVIVTGGLGPTKDDLTKAALARYFDDELLFHKETFYRLERIRKRFNIPPSPSLKIQCFLPSKAEIFNNDLGSAPGMLLKKDKVHFYFAPGVPFEMKGLFEDHFLPHIVENFSSETYIAHKTILTAGIGETMLEDLISDIEAEFPSDLSLAYLPSKAMVRLRLTIKSSSKKSGLDSLTTYENKLKERLGHLVYGQNTESLESAIADLFDSKKLTLGLAESCTGGLISSRIVSVPGASSFYLGGTVVYSNEMKSKLLDVSSKTIENHGAVSEETVNEMVKGAIQVLDVDIALGISGIAGPSGGTKEKPIGTVYIGVGNKSKTIVKKFKATKNRELNMQYFANYALNMLRLFLIEELD